MKDAYYFSHDANAHNDPKLLNLRLSSGWEGIGLYWTFLEILRDMPGYAYQEDNHLASLSLRLSTPQGTLEGWLDSCFKAHLLTKKDGLIYSDSFLRRMMEVDKKRSVFVESGRRGGLASRHHQGTLKAPSSSKGKESKVKERKDIDTSIVYGEHKNVRMSLEEYDKLANRLGKQKADEYIKRLDLYVGSKGKKYKSHYLTILAWCEKDKKPSSQDRIKTKAMEIAEEIAHL